MAQARRHVAALGLFPAEVIWLLSPYHTGSHRAWADGLARHSRHRIELLTMPGRFWKWRMQGGAMELASLARRRFDEVGPPAAIMATDMVNLPAWLALVRDFLPAGTPVLHYMHENQLTYPWRTGEKVDLTYAMINWTSQLCADQVVFNSRFHLDNWFDELPRLLKHFPDYNHLEQIDAVRDRSAVLPVGIDCRAIRSAQASQAAPREVEASEGQPSSILWNQRWEYDKRPDRFLEILYRLKRAGVPFRLILAGENFRNVPQEFDEARTRLADEIVHWGYVESYAEYVALLAQADLVISTADHEFFGISILEAIVAGAFPLAPNRLSYPELIPTELHPACLYDDEDDLFQKALLRLKQARKAPPSLIEHVVARFDWPEVILRYDVLMESVAMRG